MADAGEEPATSDYIVQEAIAAYRVLQTPVKIEAAELEVEEAQFDVKDRDVKSLEQALTDAWSVMEEEKSHANN